MPAVSQAVCASQREANQYQLATMAHHGAILFRKVQLRIFSEAALAALPRSGDWKRGAASMWPDVDAVAIALTTPEVSDVW
jgi:hypothetical protein